MTIREILSALQYGDKMVVRGDSREIGKIDFAGINSFTADQKNIELYIVYKGRHDGMKILSGDIVLADKK